MSLVPRLTAKDLTLRAPCEADLARIVEACSDEQTSYWLGTLPSPYTLEHAQTFQSAQAEQWAAGEAIGWTVADSATDILLGTVSLMDLKSGSGPEVGYWAHPAARGRGMITRAVEIMVKYAFEPIASGGLGLGKLRLESAWDNTASRRVAEQCGFREVGTTRAAIICRDGMHDAVRYVRLVTDLRQQPLRP